MNAVDQVFSAIPALVCRWHMNKNVVSKTRQVLGQVAVQNPAPGQPKYENTWQADALMTAFYSAVHARSEGEFEAWRSALQTLNRPLSDYLDAHWWKYKTHIVRPWTDRYRHFGIRDTFFVEGTHAKCKIWLRGCRGDLYNVYMSLLPWLNAAASSTSLLAQRNSVRVPYLLQGNRFAAVVRVISVYALTETNTLWEEARAIVFSRLDRDECLGVFKIVHGRSCIHDLILITESNGQQLLSPHDFDLHWWINRDQAQVPQARVQEPPHNEELVRLRRQRRGRRSGNIPYSTRRDPVLNERVDLNHPAPPPTVRRATGEITDTFVTAIPPVINADSSSVHESAAFHEPNIPARFWGYARWS